MKSILRGQQAKKGQAAMEFLMTYGWAILAAIIAIGVLAYFGVFNPGNLTGASATLSAPLNPDQNAWNIENDGCSPNDCINMEILQNSGNSINVTSAIISITSGVSTPTDCTDATDLPGTWSSGTEETFAFDCGGTGVWSSGDTIAGDITIQYTSGGSTITQQSTGSLRGTVQ